MRRIKQALVAGSLATLLFSATPSIAQDRGLPVNVWPVWTNTLVNTGGSNINFVLDAFATRQSDFDYSLQLSVTNLITNSGLATVSYELSNDGISWFGSNIAVVASSNAPQAGGKGFYFFRTGIARFMRIKAVVTQTNAYLNGLLTSQ